MERQDIVFNANGAMLGGWLYRPDGGQDRHPAIVASHGFSAVIAMGLDDFGQAFAKAGFACLIYDHRNYGRSGGWPRNETDPWQQVEDMRAAISFLRSLAFVDRDRIGLWGTSYSGGHALTVTALDRRVRCTVSMVPLVSGQRTFDAWVPAERRARFLERLANERDRRAEGAPPEVTPAALPGSETEAWAKAVDKDGAYENFVTLRSLDLMRSYEPIAFVPRIAPTPLLMVIAENDVQTPVEWQREAFVLAGDPKKLVTLPGGHYDPYMGHLAASIEASVGWFREHLG